MRMLIRNYKAIAGMLFGIVGAIAISSSTSMRFQLLVLILWISAYSTIILYSLYKKTNTLSTRLNNTKRSISDQDARAEETREYLQKQIGVIGRQINTIKNNFDAVSLETKDLHRSTLKSIESANKQIIQNQEKLLILSEESARHSRVKPEPYTLISERRDSTLSNSPGRMAAAVANDLMRSKRLSKVLGSSNPQDASARRVGLIGSERLLGFVEARCAAMHLRPSESAEQFRVFQPDLLVIEERALINGLWAGSLSSTGMALFDEIYKLIKMAKESNIIVVVIRNHGVPDINTPQLLEHALVIDKNTLLEDEWSEGYHLTTLESLRTYCIEK